MFEDREVPSIPGDPMPDDVTYQLQQEVARLVGKRGHGFVGSQPVSFASAHIETHLLRRDYFVCEKSDGLRCLMFCILDPSGEEAVFLITRDNQFYRVPNLHFPVPGDESLCHNGTLIDGEIVLSARPTDGVKELRFLMFDCLAINGKNIVSRPLDKRLGYLGEQFFKPYFDLRRHHPKETEIFPFKLSMKNMQPAYKLPRVFESLKTLGHVSDGLIFTCCETPYIFGTDETLLKWKPSEENTIDFRLHLNIPIFTDEDLDLRDPDRSYPNYDVKPGLELWMWNGGNDYSYFGELSVSDEDWEKLKGLNEPLEERVVECHKTPKCEWNLLRFRDDKSDGNHSGVVKKVLQSIQDAVSKEDLIKKAGDIENNTKQRQFARQQLHHPQQNHAAPPSHRETEQESRKRPQGDEAVPTYDDGDEETASDEEDDDDNEQVSKKPRTE